ncbi:MAG: PP0621 family protein [Burkholderiales bacterium]
MAKFLLVIAVFIVLYLLIRSHRRRGQVAAPPPSPHAENMVRCKVCGVHLPTSEAMTSRNEFYCSKEHLQIADRKHGGH